MSKNTSFQNVSSMTAASTRRATLLAVAVLVLTVPFSLTPAVAQQSRPPAVFTGIVTGVAVGGYDAVGYFSEGKPVPGKADITHEHGGATWRFSSAANRDAFKADPGKYAPQYGGHCAWAVANGYTAKGDPNAWTIAGGKLYLNYNKSVQKGWEQDIVGNVKKGDTNWPGKVQVK